MMIYLFMYSKTGDGGDCDALARSQQTFCADTMLCFCALGAGPCVGWREIGATFLIFNCFATVLRLIWVYFDA